MSGLDRALARAATGHAPDPAQAETLLGTPDERLPELLAAAGDLRDRGRGRRITFSATRSYAFSSMEFDRSMPVTLQSRG